jgi:hypothetical protein
MSDLYERTADWLRAGRERTDYWRLRAGLRVVRLDGKRAYGAGVIDALARDSGIPRASLYEYAGITRFLLAWKGISARRIFEDHPMLTYSHIRRAVRLEFEEAIDALLHAENEGMTPDQFGVYVSELQGKPVHLPIFKQAGADNEVIRNFLQNYRVTGKRIEVIVREVK